MDLSQIEIGGCDSRHLIGASTGETTALPAGEDFLLVQIQRIGRQAETGNHDGRVGELVGEFGPTNDDRGPPSDCGQQSRTWNGSHTMGLASTSSTVIS